MQLGSIVMTQSFMWPICSNKSIITSFLDVIIVSHFNLKKEQKILHKWWDHFCNILHKACLWTLVYDNKMPKYTKLAFVWILFARRGGEMPLLKYFDWKMGHHSIAISWSIDFFNSFIGNFLKGVRIRSYVVSSWFVAVDTSMPWKIPTEQPPVPATTFAGRPDLSTTLRWPNTSIRGTRNMSRSRLVCWTRTPGATSSGLSNAADLFQPGRQQMK